MGEILTGSTLGARLQVRILYKLIMSDAGGLRPELSVQQNHPMRNPQLSISEALAAARMDDPVALRVTFPGEDAGRSLAEMAQRDLDAALQLLADRAQFITGASGAAIALRRNGMNDMLCRASAGSNAPELGALLSTEFGLSGESVRTRQLLRCDDAERDERVNRDVCRRLGIASVVVMPVVNDDEVLGVFELFSGKSNAFGERDLSAVQRLSEMVETAVRLAHATEKLPEKLNIQGGSIAEALSPAVEEQVLDEEILEVDALKAPSVVKLVDETQHEILEIAGDAALAAAPAHQIPVPQASEILAKEIQPVSEKVAPPAGTESKLTPEVKLPNAETEISAPKKPVLWSAEDTETGAEKAAESDQTHVPPVLRGLRKCEACGFPISGGRVLCVECEEKKWRGQLKRPQAMPTGAIPAPAVPKVGAQAFAAAAQSAAKPVPSPSVLPGPVVGAFKQVASLQKVTEPKESGVEASQSLSPASRPEAPVEEPRPVVAIESDSPELVFSAGLEPSQSWISANKYVIGALILVAVVVAAFFVLR